MIFSFTRKREFEQVVRAYSADLYRFAYWLCRDRFVADFQQRAARDRVFVVLDLALEDRKSVV